MSIFPSVVVPSSRPADLVLEEILSEIEVPNHVLAEAKHRRELVLAIARGIEDAVRATFASGSIAHGTENSPLGDADCGIKINRRPDRFRVFGPDADEARGPEPFMRFFADRILIALREEYPRATVDIGNRALKFEVHSSVDIDDWGTVDPFVELIVGLERRDGPGIWIPNRRENGWDPADPELHTRLMTRRDAKDLRVFRAHQVRLTKRAVKRDEVIPGRVQVMFSWNLSALALEHVSETATLADGLSAYLWEASRSIADGLTEDPAEAVEEPLALPKGVTTDQAASRLAEMAGIVDAARGASSPAGARAYLEQLFGPEIEGIRKREDRELRRASRGGDGVALGAALGLPVAQKPTRSDGLR